MQKEIELVVLPQIAGDYKQLLSLSAKRTGVSTDRISFLKTIRRSMDARSGKPKINLKLIAYIDESPAEKPFRLNIQDVTNKPEVLVVGSGPAGLFAVLRLLELGLKPILFERGSDVASRTKDLAQLNRNKHFNPESNYCFGEGGAGTFSDGKLYTRSKKRGDTERILRIFRYFGADENILSDAHPHIGTDKLPGIIKNIRSCILDAGGKIYFNHRIDGLIIEDKQVNGLIDHNGTKYPGKYVILATGHSASDVYRFLHSSDVLLEPKPFAMGVRVEHPQSLIDHIQYHGAERGEFLPAASYNLAEQVAGRGVYSFCMCPGGYIVPSSTENETLVVNGMSPAKRNSRFGNSGIVVELHLEDFNEYSEHGIFAGLSYQQSLEHLAYQHVMDGQKAPAQRLADFVSGKDSANLPEISYFPGTVVSDLHNWLPDQIRQRLQQGFRLFEKKMHGFLTNEAVVLGVESRTSSPIRIPRNPVTMEHVQISGLFPAGEGSGYAGGIVSSAIDGENSAQAVFRKISAQ
ncbi:MAG: FAD-binding protein [Bacteroidia bacterium]|nr:FAD-binding protein [Bacteroidia bacterium]